MFLEININKELNWISIFSSGVMSWLLLVGCLSGAGVASRPKWDITKIGSPRKLHFFVITLQQCPWHSKSVENSQVYHVLCHHRIFYDDTKRNLLSEFWQLRKEPIFQMKCTRKNTRPPLTCRRLTRPCSRSYSTLIQRRSE